MSELQDKLKQYGFPEPDSYLNNTHPEWVVIPNNQQFDRLTVDIVERKDGVFFRDTYCLDYRLKTDSDWQAVANFIKFLKGTK